MREAPSELDDDIQDALREDEIANIVAQFRERGQVEDAADWLSVP
jgi:hypothetical protein